MSFGDITLNQAGIRYLFDQGVLSEKDFQAARTSKEPVSMAKEHFELLKPQLPDWDAAKYQKITSFEAKPRTSLWSLSAKKYNSDPKKELPGSYEKLSPMGKEIVALAGVSHGLAEFPVDLAKGLYHLGTEILPQALSEGPEGLLKLGGMMLNAAAEDVQIATGGTGKEKPVKTVGEAKRRSGRWAKACLNTLFLADGIVRAPKTLRRANQLTLSLEAMLGNGLSRLDAWLQGMGEFIFGESLVTPEGVRLAPNWAAKGPQSLLRKGDGEPTINSNDAPTGTYNKATKKSLGLEETPPIPKNAVTEVLPQTLAGKGREFKKVLDRIEQDPTFLESLSLEELRGLKNDIIQEKTLWQKEGFDIREGTTPYGDRLIRANDMALEEWFRKTDAELGTQQTTKTRPEELYSREREIRETPTHRFDTPTRPIDTPLRGLEATQVGPKAEYGLERTRPIPKLSR